MYVCSLVVFIIFIIFVNCVLNTFRICTCVVSYIFNVYIDQLFSLTIFIYVVLQCDQHGCRYVCMCGRTLQMCVPPLELAITRINTTNNLCNTNVIYPPRMGEQCLSDGS